MRGRVEEATQAPELKEAFFPILAMAENIENYETMLDRLPQCAVETYQWWRKKLLATLPATSDQMQSGTVRRVTPKVSANSSCPCGRRKEV